MSVKEFGKWVSVVAGALGIVLPLFGILYQTYAGLPLQISQLEKAIGETRRNELEGLSKRLETRIQRTDTLVSGIEKSFVRLDARVETLTQNYTAQINQRLVPMEESLRDIVRELAAVKARLSGQVPPPPKKDSIPKDDPKKDLPPKK